MTASHHEVKKFSKLLAESLHSSSKPALLLGGGAAGLPADQLDFLSSLNIPICVTWSAASLAGRISNYVGVVGQFGRPVANRAFQESDFALVLGSRLPTTVTGQNRQLLQNKIFQVDLDSSELEFSLSRLGAIVLESPVSRFIAGLSAILGNQAKVRPNSALAWLGGLRREFEMERVNLTLNPLSRVTDGSEYFISHRAVAGLLANAHRSDYLVVDGGGTALYSGFQAAPLEKFAGVVSLNAISSMGTAPGQMVGVLNATRSGRVVGIIGDGSYAMALNALPRIAGDPRAVLIVISNKGYLAIRHTQERFLGSRFTGSWYSGPDELPSIRATSRALGMHYVPYRGIGTLVDYLVPASQSGPDAATVIEVQSDPEQPAFWSVSTETTENGRPFARPLSTMIHLGGRND